MATPARRTMTSATDQLLTAATLCLAVASLLLALLQLWAPAAIIGLIAVLVGGWAQLVSETFGITLAAVVLGVSLASGGALVT